MDPEVTVDDRFHRTATLLVFDTATEHMAVGLSVRGRAWLHEAPGGARASAGLIPAVLSLLAQAGIGWPDVDAIGFGRGPGAFTGLRTACSVAQGLAFGASRPVLSIDTLMAVAEDASAATGATDIWVAMDARMNEIYAGRFCRDGQGWHVADSPALHTLDGLTRRWETELPLAVAGTALQAFGDRLACAGAVRAPDALPRAAALLRLAAHAWDAGRATPAVDALPLYLRDKVALTTVERESARAVRGA